MKRAPEGLSLFKITPPKASSFFAPRGAMWEVSTVNKVNEVALEVSAANEVNDVNKVNEESTVNKDDCVVCNINEVALEVSAVNEVNADEVKFDVNAEAKVEVFGMKEVKNLKDDNKV